MAGLGLTDTIFLRCVVCNKQLVPGDEFAFRSTDGSLFCKDDHAHDQQDSKDSLENNNNIVLQHNTSTNSSEDNSEGNATIILPRLKDLATTTNGPFLDVLKKLQFDSRGKNPVRLKPCNVLWSVHSKWFHLTRKKAFYTRRNWTWLVQKKYRKLFHHMLPGCVRKR